MKRLSVRSSKRSTMHVVQANQQSGLGSSVLARALVFYGAKVRAALRQALTSAACACDAAPRSACDAEGTTGKRPHDHRRTMICRARASFVTWLWTLPLSTLLASGSVLAQVEECSDRSPSGRWECTFRPHTIEPWQYYVAGPVAGTSTHLDEESAKLEWPGNFLSVCPMCCSGPDKVGETGWENAGNMAWAPDVAGAERKFLTYAFSTWYPYTPQGCTQPSSVTVQLYRFRYANCESAYWQRASTASGESYCYRPRRNQECTFCRLSIPSSSAVISDTDYVSPVVDGLRFVRDYRSDGFSYPGNYTANLWKGLGPNWTSNYHGAIVSTAQATWVWRGSSAPEHFSAATTSSFPRALPPLRIGQRSRLTELAPGQYAFYSADDDLVVFANGRPLSLLRPSGRGVHFSYVGDVLSSVSDTAGRTIQLVHDSHGRLQTVVDPAGQTISYGYRAPPRIGVEQPDDELSFTNLASVTYPDATTRRFGTPGWQLGGGAANWLATRIGSIVDELGETYEQITYNSSGLAISSELAGGVSRYSGSIIDPLGTHRAYSFNSSGVATNTISTISQPAGAGSNGGAKSFTHDANGNVASLDDFNAKRACYGHDMARNLEVVRVEGLAGAQVCSSVTAANVALPSGSRKISTQWHPDWRMRIKVAEPGRITTYVYNGQPDPFNSNAIAGCAPAAAMLPDGKPITVLCRQVEQATTDASGAAGFNATLDTAVANRDQKWTYNQFGQVLTHDGPRTDVNDVSSYDYYADTSFTGTGAEAAGHTVGDLQSVTNAAGKVTQYTKYDRHGQLLESIDPNGVVTTYAYDLRQRLLSTTVGGRTTSIAYDLAGQIKRVTKPDGSWIGFDYDPAHRQTAAYDNLGNRIEYLLDNAGNRIGQDVKDSSGSLRRQLARSIDALGRVQQTTGRE